MQLCRQFHMLVWSSTHGQVPVPGAWHRIRNKRGRNPVHVDLPSQARLYAHIISGLHKSHTQSLRQASAHLPKCSQMLKRPESQPERQKCRCALRVGHTSQARLPGLPTPPQLRLRYSPIPLPRYSTKRHVCGQPLRKTLPSWRSLGRWGRRAGSGPSSELWELVGHGVVLFYSVSASRSSLLP